MNAPKFSPPAGSRFFIGADSDGDKVVFNIHLPPVAGRVSVVRPDGAKVGFAFGSREMSGEEFWSTVRALEGQSALSSS